MIALPFVEVGAFPSFTIWVAKKPSKHCAAQYDMWGFHLKNQWFDGKCDSVTESMSAGTLTEAWK